MPFSSVYPHYVTKVTKKGRTEEELHTVIRWLTGFSQKQLDTFIADTTTLEQFFKKAKINPASTLITGSICGYKVQEIEDPLMQKIRFLDKIVDELAKGKAVEKICRELPVS